VSIADTSATVSSPVHQQVVGRFAAGWRQPDPHAWDDLLADDVDLHQPLMADGVGRAHWHQEFARLQAFLPDLRGEIVGWSADDDTIYVDIHCVATAGGRPLQFRAIDRLTVTPDGTVTRRDSFFDPTPLVTALLKRPAAWAAWWRSGVAPFAARRALLGWWHAINSADEPARSTTPFGCTELRRPLPLWLGVIRGCVGVTTLARPRLAYRCLGSSGEPPVGGFLARAFGARELAIALATLSSDARTARVGLRLGMVADAADVASILLGRRRRGISAGAAFVIGGAAALFASTGAAVLADGDIIEHRRRREDRPKRPEQETDRS
jgi:hypothetical protein